MDQNQGIKTWQWVVTVVVIIILIVLGYYLFKGNGTDNGANGSATTSPIATDVNEINRVIVADQFPGNVVYITSAQLANGGWVVIHKDNAGKPGAVIGSAYSAKGIAPVKVTLTEKTVDGGTYYVELHADDGDMKFDATKDLALKNSRGDIIMQVFRASSNVSEVFKG